MTIIDSQVHAYEANTPKRPWHSVPNWPDHVTGDEMVAAMDKVGVDGAIFISAFSMYRYDASYAVEVQRAHPGRFAIVKPVDPDDPAVADVVAAARAVLADAVAAAMTGAAVSLHLPTNVQLAEIERPEKPLLIRQIERNAAPAKPQSIAAPRRSCQRPPSHSSWLGSGHTAPALARRSRRSPRR